MVTTTHQEPGWIMSLRSLANSAAIELDHYLLKRPSGFAAVKRLADELRRLTESNGGDSGSPLTTMTEAVVIDPAIAFAQWKPRGPLTKIEEVLAESAHIVEALGLVVRQAEQGEESPMEDVQQLRSLCVGISKSAMAAEPVFEGSRSDTFMVG